MGARACADKANRPAGPINKSNAAERMPSATGRLVRGVRRVRAERIVIERGDAGRGETQQEAVEGEVVIDAAAVRWLLGLRCAAATSAAEIAQRHRVGDGLPERGKAGARCFAVNVAPEGAQAEDKGEDGVKRGGAEQHDHGAMRHHFVEIAGIARP